MNKKKVITLALIATLATATLTGCNKDVWDFKYTFNKAIIVNGDTATIVEIDKWTDYDGEQLQIITKDGTIIVTSSFDTKLINDKDGNIKAEDIARALVGDEGEITYLDTGKKFTLTP